ncbi:hypothetical protein CK203_114145 [Vitis vinifera]|uniref:Uncharacterized protein n=1 Tax=Vitis vinifera TaxID=29760 RepID=A0A438CAU8_VITVI|nr:hypothetical protein CK203_114145 [Vitis vinifera]
MTPKVVIRRPMVTQPPIEDNLDCRARPFHSELCFDTATFKLQPELKDSFYLLHRSGILTVIHFTIGGHHGILGARHIAKTLRIPYEPTRLEDSRVWTHPAQSDIVHILSKGASSRQYLLRKELPPCMFFIDALLRHNIFPLQHWVQRRGVLLEAMFRISEGYFFGPHHLIMAALLYFEEKVHRKKLLRADAIPLLFPRLLCQILEHLGYPAEPQLEHQGAPARPEHPEQPEEILADIPPLAPVVAFTEPIPEVAPSAPQATPRTPLVIPPISKPSPSFEPRIVISIIEYRGLCHTSRHWPLFQSILIQQITALSAHQEQIIGHSDPAHLPILRQIQHHLGIISTPEHATPIHQSHHKPLISYIRLCLLRSRLQERQRQLSHHLHVILPATI